MYGILASDKIEKQHYTVRGDVLTEEQVLLFINRKSKNNSLYSVMKTSNLNSQMMN